MQPQVIYRAKIAAGGKECLDGGPRLRFPWWSFTKTVLACTALLLVKQGRLSLDQLRPGRSYSLRQLLQHRAGVSNYGGLAAYHDAVKRGDRPWPADVLLDKVGADRLDFSPGQGWAYSNVGYFYVRRIIEEAAGADIETPMRNLVLTPLGLSSVRLAREPADLDGTAFGNQDRYHPGWVYHGLLTGTAMDAARLLDALMRGRVLPPDLLATMTDRHPLGGALPGRPWLTTGYGLGLMTGDMAKAGLAIGHSGSGPGSVCAVYHFKAAEPPCTVAAFTKADHESVTEHAVARLAVA